MVACDLNRGIGLRGGLPWRLKGDMKYFKEVTSKTAHPDKMNAVIMGRKTWDSIPPKFRPLPDRLNMVLTRAEHLELPQNVVRISSLQSALNILEPAKTEKCFVIGGAEVYRQAIEDELCELIYLTEVKGKFDCDVFFPEYKDRFELVSESEPQKENEIEYVFQIYKYKK